GLWPAFRASRADLQPDLQAGARTMTPSRGIRWNALIAAQTTLSIVLVIAGALFGRSLSRLYAADVGVDKRQVMLVSIGAGMAGRDFQAADDARHQAVAVISQSLAQRYFSGVDPIGRHLRSDSTDIEVIGIAKDVPYEGMRAERELMLYRPQRQGGQLWGTFA